MSTVKVGDELAFSKRYSPGWDFHEVTAITPSGRIKCGHYTLNPDLTIRGPSSFGPYSAVVVTEEIRAEAREIDEERLLRNRLKDVRWHDVSTDQLRRIVAILDEGAAQ